MHLAGRSIADLVAANDRRVLPESSTEYGTVTPYIDPLMRCTPYTRIVGTPYVSDTPYGDSRRSRNTLPGHVANRYAANIQSVPIYVDGDEYAHDSTIPSDIGVGVRSSDRWFENQIRRSTLTDPNMQFRTITGAYEAGGSAATGHEHSQYYDPFIGNEMYECIIRYHPPESCGPELEDYKWQHAKDAADSIVEYTVPKWKMIHPSRADKSSRVACAEEAERDIYDDERFVRYVNYDKFRLAMEARELTKQQMAADGGSTGRLVSPVNEFYDTNAPTDWSHGRLTQMKCHLVPTEAIPYPALAAYLLERPTTLLHGLYRANPVAGAHVREQLERIAAAEGEEMLNDTEYRFIENVIRLHLDEMEKYRVFDPMMIQYVQPCDSKHIETNAIRDTYNRVYSVLCGELDEAPTTYSSMIMPLTIRLRERKLPVTVENVIGEMDSMMMVRSIVDRLVTTYGEQIVYGGHAAAMQHATKEEAEILNAVGKNVVGAIIAGRCDKTLPYYFEGTDSDAETTPYGPRMPYGMSNRALPAAGGCLNANMDLSHNVYAMEHRLSPLDAPPSKEQLTYSPYTEAHDFLFRTRLRKFVAPTY